MATYRLGVTCGPRYLQRRSPGRFCWMFVVYLTGGRTTAPVLYLDSAVDENREKMGNGVRTSSARPYQGLESLLIWTPGERISCFIPSFTFSFLRPYRCMLLFLVLIPPYSYRIFAFTKYLFLYHLCSVPFRYSVHYIRKYMDILW